MENNDTVKNTRQKYYAAVKNMGKKEYTFLKMQEYGFWPQDLPTPYEKQKNETKEDYARRKKLIKEYEKIAAQITDLYKEKDKINQKLRQLKKEYDQTWDYDKIRKDVAQQIMKESIARRAERKKQHELEKQKATEQWLKHKQENIVFIGKGYSNALSHRETAVDKLASLGLPILYDDKTLAKVLELRYKELRFLTYHRDVVLQDHYHRYTIPKRSGGERNIAAPKPILKQAQKRILELILQKIKVSDSAHGFLKGKSILTGAIAHQNQPELLLNMDIKDFFPSLSFKRVRGMFQSFGYSGYIASLLAMLCTYCERMPIEVKGQTKYIKTSERILPQGSPASPMITNIICRNMDQKLNHLAEKYGCTYSRYADDLSFSFEQQPEKNQIGKIVHKINCVLKDEGFETNPKKTRYLRKNNQQCVTGIIVNNKQIGVPKKWVKNMRAALYNASKLKRKQELPSDTRNEIAGMMHWLQAVNEERYHSIIISAKRVLKN